LFPNQCSQEFNYKQDTNVEHGTATAYCYSCNKDGSLPAAMVTIHYHNGLVTKNETMELKNKYKIQSFIESPCHNADRPI